MSHDEKNLPISANTSPERASIDGSPEVARETVGQPETASERTGSVGGMTAGPTAGAAVRYAAPAAEATDDRLVELHLAGDAHAFRELVRRHERRAASLAWRLLGNSDDVEEVCQEAFLKVHQKMGDLEQAGSFFPWFFSIVLNLCRERLRTRRRLVARARQAGAVTDREVPVADIPDDTLPDAWQTIEADEQRRSLEQALEALPDIYRQVIVLRCYEGLSYTEIAQVMRCRKRTVRWRLYRARQILRGCLKDT